MWCVPAHSSREIGRDVHMGDDRETGSPHAPEELALRALTSPPVSSECSGESWPWVGPTRATTCMFQPRLPLNEHLAAPAPVVGLFSDGACERAGERAGGRAGERARHGAGRAGSV